MPDAHFVAPPPAQDAYRHKLTEEGRESLAHMLIYPQHGIAGFIYPSMHGDGRGRGRATLFGPGLGGEVIQEEVEGTVPASMGFEDFRLPPLRMAVEKPHERVALAWDGDRIKFDAVCEGGYAPYAFSSHPDGNPPYYGDDRTEQHLRVLGKLSVDGKEMSADGWLVRDHSWGPRVWGLNQHYKWVHLITESTSIHYFEMLSFGRRQLRGYLDKDGVRRHIAEARYDFTYDDQMFQKTFQTEVIDTEGRTAVVDSKAFANMQVILDPEIYLHEAAVTLTIDGKPGVGWVEFCWNRNYLDFAKKYVTRFG